MKIPFVKMHGIGNDYVYLDFFENQYPDIEWGDLAQKIAHRHFGVGGDGLVLILPGKETPVQMRMFNSDGSEAEMCGNAVRCIGGYVHNHGHFPEKNFQVQTKAGLIGIEIQEDGLIKVDMGKPILKPTEIPINVDGDRVIDHPLEVEGFKGTFTGVSMGNPHAVFFLDKIESLKLEQFGPLIEHHELFPNRINSEFIEILSPKEVNFRVWERGAGETWACGTGAAASHVAGVMKGVLEEKVLFHLKGGDLILETDENLSRVYIHGPYEEVAKGIYYYSS